MGRLGGFKYKQVIAKLQKLGLILRRQGKGSHEVWYNPKTDCLTIIPKHKDIAEFTLKSILKQAKISIDEFLES